MARSSTIARKLTDPDRAGENARLAQAAVTGAVRKLPCPECGAHPFGPCQVQPPADHLRRWLAAINTGRIKAADAAALLTPADLVTDEHGAR